MADGGLRVTSTLEFSGLSGAAREAGRAAAMAAGEAILARAAGLAPRRTGALAGSGSVSAEGDGAVVRFGAPYAAVQHEGTGFRHPGGGQAKYLADAVSDPAATAAMAEAFWRTLGG